jgi:hypothetical protein
MIAPSARINHPDAACGGFLAALADDVHRVLSKRCGKQILFFSGLRAMLSSR